MDFSLTRALLVVFQNFTLLSDLWKETTKLEIQVCKKSRQYGAKCVARKRSLYFLRINTSNLN